MKELREIEGIKFYDTPEMGIACSVTQISIAIIGKPNRGGIRRSMLTSGYVKTKFPNPEEREKQIQYLEYPGMNKQPFISLELLLLYLETGKYTEKYKEKYDRLFSGIRKDLALPRLNPPPTNQEEIMKELCEIEGIKFYDTPEMGIVCLVREINAAISGKSNRGGFSRNILNYQYVKDAFPISEERDKQIQHLEYSGMGPKLFASLELILVHLKESAPYKYQEGCDRVLQAIEKNPILKSNPPPTNQEEIMKELCEIEGIKFYDTPEMGIVCLVREINAAISGNPENGTFGRKMLEYEYVKDAFPDPKVRKEQIQYLEYPGMSKRSFVSLQLLVVFLRSTHTHRKYKEKYDRLLQEIEEIFPHLKNTLQIASDLGTTTTPKQELLPIAEEEYSFLYIAKAGTETDSAGNITTPLDIHFGITAADPKTRIKAITSGSYKAQLVATIAFRGTQEKQNGVKIACEECAALETYFKSNKEWRDIRGTDESFRYVEPWITLLKEIEEAPKAGLPFHALYPDSPIIRELVPEHLIPKIHDFGEGREMMEVARLYIGDVIPGENNLNVSFEDDWIIVRGLRPVKKR